MSIIILLFPILISVLFGWVLDFKAGLMFYTIHSIGMYLHLTFISTTNVFLGNKINAENDAFWKLFYLTLSSICLTILLSV